MDLVTPTPAPCLPIGAPPGHATLRWVEGCLGTGAEVRMVRPLPGGTAHANHALVVETPSGSAHGLVLRRWPGRDPGLDAGPGRRSYGDTEFSPEREIAALALLAGCEIPTPELVAADPSGA